MNAFTGSFHKRPAEARILGETFYLPGIDFGFRYRYNRAGVPVGLHSPLVFASDIHFGTHSCRAQRFVHALHYLSTDHLILNGDILDGERMQRKRYHNLGPWHRQGIAEIYRMAAEGATVDMMGGNHDVELRARFIKGGNLFGVNMVPGHWVTDQYGTYVVQEKIIADPAGRRLLVTHGDLFDNHIFGKSKNLWYHLGAGAYDANVGFDNHILQKLPHGEHLSSAAWSKRQIKSFINKKLGLEDFIYMQIDKNPDIDGLSYGHVHTAALATTSAGKLIINSGCSTEQSQTVRGDEQGRYVIVESYYQGLKITDQHQNARFFTWDEIGLPDVTVRPVAMEPDNIYLQNAQRTERLIARQWRPKSRIEALKRLHDIEKAWAAQNNETGRVIPPMTVEDLQRAAFVLPPLTWREANRRQIMREQITNPGSIPLSKPAVRLAKLELAA